MSNLGKPLSNCRDGSETYSLDDFVRGEDGRFDLPDHHSARFYPQPSPTPEMR